MGRKKIALALIASSLALSLSSCSYQITRGKPEASVPVDVLAVDEDDVEISAEEAIEQLRTFDDEAALEWAMDYQSLEIDAKQINEIEKAYYEIETYSDDYYVYDYAMQSNAGVPIVLYDLILKSGEDLYTVYLQVSYLVEYSMEVETEHVVTTVETLLSQYCYNAFSQYNCLFPFEDIPDVTYYSNSGTNIKIRSDFEDFERDGVTYDGYQAILINQYGFVLGYQHEVTDSEGNEYQASASITVDAEIERRTWDDIGGLGIDLGSFGIDLGSLL